MEAVPHGEKQQSCQVTYVLIVEELESFVDVLKHPSICLHVEGCHILMEVVGVFKDVQLNISATSPVLYSGLLVT